MKNQTKKLYPDTYTAWKNSPNKDNTSKLLKSISPVISSAVKSYGNNDPKTVTRARILAMKAIRSYDPSKGNQLNTHVMSQLKALNRISRQRSNLIHLPENIYFNRKVIEEARVDHVHRTGKDPSDTDIADATGLTKRQINKASEYKNPVASSTFTSDKGDAMKDHTRDYYDIWVDYVYNDMDDTDKKIFEGVSGYNNKPIKPKQQLAKELKMSPAAVSYRVSNITSKLEEMPTNEVG